MQQPILVAIVWVIHGNKYRFSLMRNGSASKKKAGNNYENQVSQAKALSKDRLMIRAASANSSSVCAALTNPTS